MQLPIAHVDPAAELVPDFPEDPDTGKPDAFVQAHARRIRQRDAADDRVQPGFA